MRRGKIAGLLLGLVLGGVPGTAWSQTATAELSRALDELHAWLGNDGNASKWRAFIRSEDLAAELSRGGAANPETVRQIAAVYGGPQHGLQLRRFVAVRSALDGWLTELEQPIGDLPAAVKAAKSHFRPVTPEQVRAAHAQLVAAAAELERWLQSGTEEAATAWKKRLDWDGLQKELTNPTDAKPEALDRIAALYRADEAGLELQPFRSVRKALRDYADTLRFSADAKTQETYAENLDKLAKHLELLATTPTTDDLAAAGQLVHWLERSGQSPQIVAATRARFQRPNLFASASRQIVEAAFDDPEAKAKLNEPQPLHDNILGTSLHGTVYPNLRMRVELIPSHDQATISVQLLGAASSSSIGYQGPVTVWTSGHTQIATNKHVYFDANGISSSGTGASCSTSSNIDSIAAKRCLIEKIAWKRAAKQKCQAEAIASAHAEVRISNQVDSEMGARLADAHRSYLDKFRSRLVRRDSFPELFDVSSSADAVRVQIRHANGGQLASATEPPELSGDHDLNLRLHESAITNFGESLIGGETLTDERLVEILKENKTEIPEELQVTADKDPWSITFSSSQPVSAQFAENRVKLSIRGRQFTRGDQVVRAVIEISATYTLEKSGSGSKLTRQGDVSVEYVNRPNLSVTQVAMKTFFRKKFEALFKPEIKSDGLKLPERFDGIGKLQLRQLSADRAWLVLGWGQQSESPQITVAALAGD